MLTILGIWSIIPATLGLLLWVVPAGYTAIKSLITYIAKTTSPSARKNIERAETALKMAGTKRHVGALTMALKIAEQLENDINLKEILRRWAETDTFTGKYRIRQRKKISQELEQYLTDFTPDNSFVRPYLMDLLTGVIK